MQIIKNELVGTPTRRIEFELPDERAEKLARTLDDHITWSETEVEDELSLLYDALLGDAG